jgi:hypothetical protein
MVKIGTRGFSAMGNSNISLILRSAQSGVCKPVQNSLKMKILSEGGEKWDSGVFDYGEFKIGGGFEIHAMAGLQTGSKRFKNTNFVGSRWNFGFWGFWIWRIQIWNLFYDLRKGWFADRFKKFLKKRKMRASEASLPMTWGKAGSETSLRREFKLFQIPRVGRTRLGALTRKAVIPPYIVPNPSHHTYSLHPLNLRPTSLTSTS